MLRTLTLVSFFTIFVTLLSGCANGKSSIPTAYDPSLEQYSAEQLLETGEAAIAKNNFKQAIKYLHALDVKYPFSPFTRQGQLDLIYAYYKQDDLPQALAAADRYIRVYPRGPAVDYAYYIKGLINMGKGRDPIYRKLGIDPALRDLSHVNQSFSDFTTIVKLFPHSPYAKEAQSRLVYLRNLLARHELLIAEFYMDKKTYIGAANRAAYIVEHFQGAPQVEDALVIMVKAYRAIGEERLANNALSVLKVNYPNRQVK